MRLIFMGNPAFAVPGLRLVASSGQDVVAVVSNPPKEMGRGKKLLETAIAGVARELDIPLIQPVSLKNLNFIQQLSDLKPDLLVVVAFRILPKSVLAIPQQGSVNLHASLLPAYRGAAPIQWAIINGETQTGITTFLIQPKVDTGDILMQKSIPILTEDNYGTLSKKLSHLGADLLVETLNRLESGRLTPRPQDHSKASAAPKITKEHCRIDWLESAEKIHNLIRGLAPFPGAYTTFKGRRIKIYQTAIVETLAAQAKPGNIVERTRNTLIVSTGNAGLSIKSLQREGKRQMKISEFLLGSDIDRGDILGH